MLVEIVDNAIINHIRERIPFLTWAGIAFSFTSAVSEWNKYETNWMKKIIAAILLHITKAWWFWFWKLRLYSVKKEVCDV